jgi:glycyl-tRNA synthetase beta chain
VKDLLLEIGTEEIPARFVPEALRALESAARASLAESGLTLGDVKVWGTPRRLAVFVERLADKSRDRTTESLGPALAQAKGPDGAWTPAAVGFARGQGIALEALGVKDTDRGPRLVAVKSFPGAPAEKLLPGLLADWVARLAFPKSMVWEEGRVAFARPIRWLTALHGAKVVPLIVAGVKSGKKTRGLRFHARKPLDVAAPGKYAALLRNHCVIVDPAERKALIAKQIQQAVKTVHGHVPLERYDDLLDEVVHLVEHPVAIVGRFDEKHLALPPAVLITSMKKHQKYFPVFADAAGRALTAHFVGIRNGLSDHQTVVREGYERVLAARLADAAFFFEQDRRRPLADRVGDLAGIAFLSPKLNLKDKTDRTVALTAVVAAGAGASADTADAAGRAALLAKADLTTGVVGEFPELQGVMGRIYAGADGESPVVAAAVEQHYWPLTADGPLPAEGAAALVSVADKLDTLAGNFLIGKIPSGSQDPYGLRRASIGLLRVLEERAWPLSLPGLVDEALARLPDALGDKAAGRRALLDFLRQRWAALAEARGARFDEVDAVLSAGFDRVAEAGKRLEALRAVRRHPDFEPLSAAYKRAANLLKQAEKKGEAVATEIAEAALSLPEEKTLLDTWRAVAARVTASRSAGDAGAAFTALVALREPVDRFFAAAVVMDPDPERRRARLGLLAGVRQCFAPLADLSRLQDTPGPSA